MSEVSSAVVFTTDLGMVNMRGPQVDNALKI